MHVFDPSLISEVKGGYMRVDIESLPLNDGSNLSNPFGVPGVDCDAVTSGLALMTLTGYSNLGDSTFVPLIQIDNVWQAGASVTKTTGAHNVTFWGTYIAREFTVFQSASPTYTKWFNTSAFQTQPVNTIGGAVVNRNALRGPHRKVLHVSLFKNVRVSSTLQLQLRLEAYNVLNAVNFANPNAGGAALGNTAFGTISSTVGTPRQMQFAVKLLF